MICRIQTGPICLIFAAVLLSAGRYAGAQDAGVPLPDADETGDIRETEPYGDGEEAAEEDGPLVDFRTEDLDRDYVEPPPEREINEDDLRGYFELYKNAVKNSSLDEADTLAKRIIELAIELYGIDSYDSARALTNLGIVQHRSKDYNSAQLNYQAAIDIIERIGDRLNSELINPLKGLGAAQLASGRPDLALQTFGRAVHVSHVNEGPHNLMQVEILDALTETHLSVGDVDEALDMQENIYNLQTRKIDQGGDDMLLALRRQAEWMHRLQYYGRERTAYRRIIRIIEATRGKKSISLIPPLTGLGKSYLFIEPYDPDYQTYKPASGGETYLKRALRIAEKSEDSNWEILRDAMLALGDFNTLADNPNRARRSYLKAWELLAEDEERQPSLRKNLQSSVVLQDISPPKYYNSERTDDGSDPPDNFERGNIVVGFNISEYGQPYKIELIEAQPPGLEAMERVILREVRDLRYRPRIEEGKLKRVGDMTYTHEFYYRESDLPDPTAGTEAAAEPGDDQGGQEQQQ